MNIGLVFKWWFENWTEKSLFMVQNVRYLNGLPSHITLPFVYQTLLLSGIQVSLLFSCSLCSQIPTVQFKLFFYSSSLSDLKAINTVAASSSTAFDTDHRIFELATTNSMTPFHLQSVYPVSTTC